jgi:hypothetical protein
MVKIKVSIDIILAALTFVALVSIVKYIDPIILVLSILLISFAIYNEYKLKFFINRKILTLFAFLISGVIISKLNLDNFIYKMIQIVILFIIVKYFEEKKYRDYMQIITLLMFLITSSALLNFSMIFIVYILLIVFLGNIFIILLTIYDNSTERTFNKSDFKSLIFKYTIIPVISIPFATLLFIIIPRTEYPLFDFLNRNDKGKTGFSSNLNLGVVSEIQEDESVAFRIKMPQIDNNFLYFRAVVFDRFEKNRFKSDISSKNININFNKNHRVNYEIFLEPTNDKYLITLDVPFSVSMQHSNSTEKLEYILDKNIYTKTGYTGISILTDSYIDNFANVKKYIDKKSIPLQILDFAKQFEREDKTDTINEVLTFFKDDFTYSLTDLPTGDNAIEDFLFSHKKGNCEYFATGFALILRSLDIPTRLVGGFRGGYYKKDIGYYVVLNKNAHVWVETLLDNRWKRLDPTPLAISHFVNENNLTFKLKLRFFLDDINYYWTKFVINYGFDTQIFIAKNIGKGFKKLNFSLKYNKFIISFLAIVAILVIILISYKYKREKNYHYLLVKFYNLLQKKGVIVDYTKTISENISEISDKDLKSAVEKFEKEFNRYQFSSYKDIKLLKKYLQNIKRKTD